MQRKPSVPIFATLIMLALVGLGYIGWKDGRQIGTKSWMPPALTVAVAITETPTPGWWDDLPSHRVIPTMPGRIVITVSVTGTPSVKTIMPAKTITGTPLTSAPKENGTAKP